MESTKLSAAVAAATAALLFLTSSSMPAFAADAPSPAAATPKSAPVAGSAASPAVKKSVAPAEPAVATVNGLPISRSIFEYYVKTNTGKTSADFTPEQRSQLLDNLIRGELLSQQALKDGLDKNSDVAFADRPVAPASTG